KMASRSLRRTGLRQGGAADRRSSRLPGTSLRSVVLLALGALATAPLLGTISRNSLPAFAAGFAPLDRTSWRAVAMHAVGDADVKAPAKASATAESAVQQVTLQEVPEQSASQVTLQEVENPELKKEPVEEGKRLRQFLALEPLDEEQDPSGGNQWNKDMNDENLSGEEQRKKATALVTGGISLA
ncbi:unnamed protein product, partial [Polarella glacialis]